MRYKGCDNIIISRYHANAGGKFVINCLGLSNQCYLQDIELVRKQRAGQLTPNDKLFLLKTRIEQTHNDWNDLELGCVRLFGSFKNGGIDSGPYETREYTSEIDQLSRERKYFFLIAHYGLHDLEKKWQDDCVAWPNAKIIYFINNPRFVKWRTGLDDDIQDYPVPFHPRTLIWNCDWFYNKKHTVHNIKKLYGKLRLKDFNEDYIAEYYTSWMNKIIELKSTVDKQVL